MRKDLRKGKVYIDYHRNGRGATAVAPYSTRAREGAPVSMPIEWSRLSRIKSANQFTVNNIKTELKKAEPWRDLDRKRVDVRKQIGQQE
jgi:bifunctional non-homologous end joining protein LigD